MTLHEIHLERTSAKASLAERPVPSAVAAAIAPAASIRLADDQTAAVRVGFSRDEVLQALGKPHSRVSRVTQARTVTPN